MKHSTMQHILTALLLLLCTAAWGQSAQDEIAANTCLAGSNYLAYPTPSAALTPAPGGKKPFYISHYGRHGSRYLIQPAQYQRPLDILEKAYSDGVLTPLGKQALRTVRLMWEESKDRYGELTPLGALQHRQIARRMAERFPDVFKGDAVVDAKSTVVIRCILSMENALQELVSINPKLRIKHDASAHDMFYMNHHDEQIESTRHNEATRHYRDSITNIWVNAEEILRKTIDNEAYIHDSIDAFTFCTDLFRLANILQNSELGQTENLYTLFTEDEIYGLWMIHNVGWFVEYGSCTLNGGGMPRSQRYLLKQIVQEADSCIALEKPGATLRFGHETMVLPLTCLMNINGYGRTMHPDELLERDWANYRIFPMGANIQLVFYRKNPKDNDVLVKVLLNEEEATLPLKAVEGCYYRWSDIKDYFQKVYKL